MQEGGQGFDVWAYVTTRKFALSDAMYGIFTVFTPVIMMAEACDVSLRDDYVFLIVVVVFAAGSYIAGAAFRTPVDVDVFMLIDSLRDFPGGALMAYRSAFLFRGMVIVIMIVVFLVRS